MQVLIPGAVIVMAVLFLMALGAWLFPRECHGGSSNSSGRCKPTPPRLCTKARLGWYCTRTAGHEGPCAARYSGRMVPSQRVIE